MFKPWLVCFCKEAIEKREKNGSATSEIKKMDVDALIHHFWFWDCVSEDLFERKVVGKTSITSKAVTQYVNIANAIISNFDDSCIIMEPLDSIWEQKWYPMA